jgi:serine phosphatase RsbU (regulator of sigma subunit)
MFRDLSYRTKLLAGICSLVLVTGIVIITIAYRTSRATTARLTDDLFREVSGHVVTQTRNFVMEAGPLVESLQSLAGNGLAVNDSDRLARQFTDLLKAHPGLTRIDLGDESGNFTSAYRQINGALTVRQTHLVNGKSHLVEHDVTDGGWKLLRKDDDAGYDPRVRPYYMKTKEVQRLVWVDPYLFFDPKIPGITCGAPLFDAQHKFSGVVAVDFNLDAISQFVSQLSVSPHSELFVFSNDGALLAHRDWRLLTKPADSADAQLPRLIDVQDPLVSAVHQNYHLLPRAAGGDPRFRSFDFDVNGTPYFASATRFKVGNDLEWIVGAVAPKSDLMGDVWRSQRLMMIAALIALLAAAVLAALLARRVSGPVASMVGFMKRVGAGDLEAQADFRTSTEFQQLTDGLNRMIADLRDGLRLRHSLNVAMEVQQRLLPPCAPPVKGLDIAGHSSYCDETGGDYYDFMVVDPVSQSGVIFAVGDVMGHGVAAALVMAGARAVLRDRIDSKGSLAAVMTRLNNLLAADLDGTRFMTMHLALIDTKRGIMRWSSAGHDPALVYDPGTDQFSEFGANGLPLGIMPESEYLEETMDRLHAGTIITVGTAGVWETRNPQGEQFGKDRLRDVIRRAASEPAETIVANVIATLREFSGDVKWADDVTFIVIKVTAVESSAPRLASAPEEKSAGVLVEQTNPS